MLNLVAEYLRVLFSPAASYEQVDVSCWPQWSSLWILVFYETILCVLKSKRSQTWLVWLNNLTFAFQNDDAFILDFVTWLPCKLYVLLFRYGVAVQDFASSWRSGLAFLAVIKAIDSTLVDMKQALEKSARENLEDAFSIAQNKLGVPRLLEPEGKMFTSMLLGNIQAIMN